MNTQNTHRLRKQDGGWKEGGRENEAGKGAKYMATEGDQTLSGEHTMEYTDVL